MQARNRARLGLRGCAVALASVAMGAAMVGLPIESSTAGAATNSTPGITKNTVTIGQIDDISKPVPGLFRAAEVGTQAYVDYVNSKGGINGRKLVLDARDSNFDSSNVVTQTRSQAKHDFALVGGFSLLDQAEGPIINQYKIPDMAVPLSYKLANNRYLYSPAPSTINATSTGPFMWLKKAFPSQSRHVGILYAAATPASTQSQFAFDRVMRQQGLKILYQRGFSALESTFSADVLKMKTGGVTMYVNEELPGSYAATLAKESALQSYHPINVEGAAAYISNMGQLAGSAANGMYLQMPTALYQGQDAKAVPEVATFDKWAKKVDPGVFKLTTPLPAVYGWVSGMLFAQALKAAGPNPTRSGLISQLNKVTSFNANGLLPPGENPAKNIPSKCFLVAQYKNGNWHRVSPTPKTGYICNGTLSKRPGWKPQKR